MATILAVGNTDAVSSTFSLTTGQAIALTMIPGVSGNFHGNELIEVQVQVGGSYWVTIRYLKASVPTQRSQTLAMAGTFRCHRPVQTNNVGVDGTS